MLAVMNDSNAQPARRDRAAMTLLPYLHSRLTPKGWLPDTRSPFDLSTDEEDEDDKALSLVKRLVSPTNGHGAP